jgi:hypothetical protein
MNLEASKESTSNAANGNNRRDGGTVEETKREVVGGHDGRDEGHYHPQYGEKASKATTSNEVKGAGGLKEASKESTSKAANGDNRRDRGTVEKTKREVVGGHDGRDEGHYHPQYGEKASKTTTSGHRHTCHVSNGCDGCVGWDCFRRSVLFSFLFCFLSCSLSQFSTFRSKVLMKGGGYVTGG